jgi:hypothetical protein
MLRTSLVVGVTAILLGVVTPAGAFLQHIPANGTSLNGLVLDKKEMHLVFQQDRQPGALPSNGKDANSRAEEVAATPLRIEMESTKGMQHWEEPCVNCFVRCCPMQ